MLILVIDTIGGSQIINLKYFKHGQIILRLLQLNNSV